MTSFLPQLPPRAWLRRGQHLRRAAGRGNLLQLALREEADVIIVRRPEGISRAFGSVQPAGIGRADRLHEDHALAGVFVDGDVGQHASVGRDAQCVRLRPWTGIANSMRAACGAAAAREQYSRLRQRTSSKHGIHQRPKRPATAARPARAALRVDSDPDSAPSAKVRSRAD